MERIPVATVARTIGIATLPDPRVLTKDGVKIEEGMHLYQAYTPEKLVEYEVVHDVAFYDEKQGHWEVVVLGSHLPVVSMEARNFLADHKRWVEFWQQRHRTQEEPALDWSGDAGDNHRRKRRRRRKKSDHRECES